MPPRLTDTRRAAVIAAIEKVVKEADGSENAAARLLGVKQQTLNRALKLRSVGELVADRTADYYGTTLDGLVRHFTQGEGPVRAGDIIGWRKAVEEAQRHYAIKLEPWAWHRAADIVLPMAPELASREFAFALASVLAMHCEVTHVGTRAVSR
jgi:hypothetical protein